jgi:hypothetical protein
MVVKLDGTIARAADRRRARVGAARRSAARVVASRTRVVRRPWGPRDPWGAAQSSAVNRKNHYTMRRSASQLANARTVDTASI